MTNNERQKKVCFSCSFFLSKCLLLQMAKREKKSDWTKFNSRKCCFLCHPLKSFHSVSVHILFVYFHFPLCSLFQKLLLAKCSIQLYWLKCSNSTQIYVDTHNSISRKEKETMPIAWPKYVLSLLRWFRLTGCSIDSFGVTFLLLVGSTKKNRASVRAWVCKSASYECIPMWLKLNSTFNFN